MKKKDAEDRLSRTRFTLTDAHKLEEEVKRALEIVECKACKRRMARIDVINHKETGSCRSR